MQSWKFQLFGRLFYRPNVGAIYIFFKKSRIIIVDLEDLASSLLQIILVFERAGYKA